MRRFRFGFLLMVAGFAAKGTAVVAYHFSHLPFSVKVLTAYDPLGARIADALLPLFFDLRGIAPPPGAPIVYDILLTAAFVMQCFVLGLAISETRRRVGSDPKLP